jgi:hypothetical protein
MPPPLLGLCRGEGFPRMRDIDDDNAIDDIVIGNAVPMPWKNGI